MLNFILNLGHLNLSLMSEHLKQYILIFIVYMVYYNKKDQISRMLN